LSTEGRIAGRCALRILMTLQKVVIFSRTAVMIPTLQDMLAFLNRVAPMELAESWDNPGLQVGDLSQRIQKVCVALDPTVDSVRASLEQNSQLLLTHHPLIFSPLSRFDLSAYPANVVLEAAKAGLSIVAVHTNLDQAEGGISDMLAESLQLDQVSVLKEIDGKTGCGLGRIGVYPSAILLTAFIARIKEILGTSRLKTTGEADRTVRRVAVVGGSGGSLVREAFRKGADLLLTGDVGHHHALEARSLGLALVDGGHFLTERLALKRFAELLQNGFKAHDWDVQVTFLTGETDPMIWM
jgi:GTP cyclohydrolase I